MPRAHVVPDGAKIAALRGEADLTQWELAKQAGYGLRTIGKIENGQRTGASTLTAVATVLGNRLKRPVRLADLIQRSASAAPCCCHPAASLGWVEENTQFLDLSGWRPAPRPGSSARPGTVVLLDRYRFRELPAQPLLALHYATMGERIEAECLSHPDGQEWLDRTERNRAATGDSPRKQCYELRLHPDRPAPGEWLEVHNRITYINAFQRPDCEWFHTHVEYPTEGLTVLLLFPEHRPVRSLRGVCQHHPAEPFVPVAEPPIALLPGRLSYWRVRTPRVGGTHRLEWEW
jgi:DNA-binding XRE family transcriptional regulator